MKLLITSGEFILSASGFITLCKCDFTGSAYTSTVCRVKSNPFLKKCTVFEMIHQRDWNVDF